MILYMDSLLEELCFIYFLTNYLTKNTRLKNAYVFLFLFLSFLLSSLSYFEIVAGSYTDLSVIAIGFIYCYYLFSNSFVEILFALLFSISMLLFTNILAIFLTKFVLLVTFHNILYFNQIFSTLALFSKLFYIIAIIYITKRKKETITVSSASMIYLLIIYVLLTAATIIGLKNYANTAFLNPVIEPIILILSSLFFLIYFLYTKLCEETSRNIELILFQKETENIKGYMDTLTKINNENKTLRHDLKNMLLLAKNEGNEKQNIYDEIEKNIYSSLYCDKQCNT